MAEIDLKTFEQLAGLMVSSYTSRLGVSDDNIGSVFLSFIEAAAQNDINLNAQLLATLDTKDIDRADDAGLDLIGAEEDCLRLGSIASTGYVNLIDGNFTKVSTRVYSGTFAPTSGSTIIYADDASSFPSTGYLNIGKGTVNIETRVQYTAKTLVGSYWQFNLAASTSKFHNQGEEVTLSQGGDRTVSTSSIAQTSASAISAPLTFALTQNAIIPDGEDTLIGVQVACQVPGSTGNVAIGAISQFTSPPFQNAQITNPLSFTNGADKESNFDYKERIKKKRLARIKGPMQSMLSAVIGLTSIDEPKRIVSADYNEGSDNDPSVIYIDDGNGYEPIFQNIGYEAILDSANGGEQNLQLQNPGLVKAQLISINSQPYSLMGNEYLNITIGTTLYSHQFQSSDFAQPGYATAYEIAASINADTNLQFSCRTISGGQKLIIFSKTSQNEDLQVANVSNGTDANSILNFPITHQYTLQLYKNDKILKKDGSAATLTSEPYPWILPGSSYALKTSVDGTTFVTYTFDSTNLTPYLPSNTPLATWAQAFNNTVPGISAVTQNNRLVISSNKGSDSKASIAFDTTSSTLLNNNQVFTTYSVTGSSVDYTLNRGTGQISLANPASPSDQFTAGTPNFKAYIQSSAFSSGTITVTSSQTPLNGNLWLIADATVNNIALALTNNISISVTNPSTNVWRYNDASNSNAFVNVSVGDYFISWDKNLSANNRGGWRVANKTAAYVEVEKSTGTAESITVSGANTLTCYRSSGELQQVTIASSVYTLDSISTYLNNNLKGLTASVANTNKLRITTNTSEQDLGSISLLAADLSGQTLNISNQINVKNNPTHISAIKSGNTDQGSPDFLAPLTANSSTTNGVFVNNSSVTVNPDRMLEFTKPFSSTRYSNNRYKWEGIKHLVQGSTSITTVSKVNIDEFLTNDRAFIGSGFDFTGKDSLNVILDDTPSYKSLSIPVYRTLQISSSPSPTVNSFSAVDADSNNQALTTTFGTFDFTNYRLWGYSKALINCDNANNAFIVKSAMIGPTGNYYRFGIDYPSAANSATFTSQINTNITIGGFDIVTYLPSGTARAVNWGNDTTFNVNSSGVYSYNTGTTPNFLASSIVAGDIVTINSSTSFSSANIGTYRVTNVTITAFTVNNASATSDSNKGINATANINFYPIGTGSTATNIVNYINFSLSNYLSASLGVGESGAGLVDRRFTDFSSGSTTPTNSGNFVQLADGQNWLFSCNLSNTTQFVTEQNFTNFGSLYTLVGEKFKVIPYTTQQLATFVSDLAVSGINNLGSVSASNDGNALEFSSTLFGTSGAVQVSGGSANAVSGTVVGTASTLNNSFNLFKSTVGVTDGIQNGSWLKLSNSLPFKKDLGTDATTSFQISGANLAITAGSGAFQVIRTHSGSATTQIQVEKNQNFIAFVWTGTGTNPIFTNVIQGDFVNISGNFNTTNKGYFRVVRALTNIFWIENSQATEELVTLSANSDLKFYSADSVLPNDTLVLSGGLLSSVNDGSYTVQSVTTNSITIDLISFPSNYTSPFSANFGNVQCFDSIGANLYKKVCSFNPIDTSDSTLCNIIVYDAVSQLNDKISDRYQTSFAALNKLNFDTKKIYGIDGYQSYRGLISEANKTIFGDPTNTIAYPGFKASGPQIDIVPPLIKKVLMTIGIRLKTGVSFAAIVNSVRSSVIGVINKAIIGQSVAISDIIAAINLIEGVAASSIISPAYSSSNDSLLVGTGQKLLVTSENDITIVLLS